MPIVQQLPPEERLMYPFILWFVVGLVLGWLLCRAGVGA